VTSFSTSKEIHTRSRMVRLPVRRARQRRELPSILVEGGDGEFSIVGEKRAFEKLIDFVITRLDRTPRPHLPLRPYEPTAMKRLMGRHATHEDEVDRLLRGAVLVDLYRAIRQGLRASVDSYSIKRLEPLYGLTRTIDLRDAGSSIVRLHGMARARR